MRDSNPRYPKEGIPDFESSAFGHSANLPCLKCLNDAKIVLFLVLTKYLVFFLTILMFREGPSPQVSRIAPTFGFTFYNNECYP